MPFDFGQVPSTAPTQDIQRELLDHWVADYMRAPFCILDVGDERTIHETVHRINEDMIPDRPIHLVRGTDITASLLQLPFPERTFHMTYARDVFEQLTFTDIVPAMMEALRVTKDHVLFSFCAGMHRENQAIINHTPAGEVIYTLCEAMLEEAAQCMGFAVVEIRPYRFSSDVLVRFTRKELLAC